MVAHQGVVLDALVEHQEVGHQAQELAEPAVEARPRAGRRAERQEDRPVDRYQADLQVGADPPVGAGRYSREENFGWWVGEGRRNRAEGRRATRPCLSPLL